MNQQKQNSLFSAENVSRLIQHFGQQSRCKDGTGWPDVHHRITIFNPQACQSICDFYLNRGKEKPPFAQRSSRYKIFVQLRKLLNFRNSQLGKP